MPSSAAFRRQRPLGRRALRHGRRANATVGDHPPRRVDPASARVFFQKARLRGGGLYAFLSHQSDSVVAGTVRLTIKARPRGYTVAMPTARDPLYQRHATTIGAISALALAAIDTALWDLRCRRCELPLWIVAGGTADRRPLYTTEGGWLHFDEQALVARCRSAPFSHGVAREPRMRGPKREIRRIHSTT